MLFSEMQLVRDAGKVLVSDMYLLRGTRKVLISEVMQLYYEWGGCYDYAIVACYFSRDLRSFIET